MEHLTDEQKHLLYRAPLLISLLAAGTDEKIDRKEKSDAEELAHFRTFSAPSLLRDYYKQVEKEFEKDFDNLIKKYFPLNENNQNKIKKELEKTYAVFNELDPVFKENLISSLNSYAKHVGTIHRNFLEYFVLPLNIPGVTD